MFRDRPWLDKLGGRNYKVVKGFVYTTKDGVDIAIPDGFITDFASIPRGLWNLFPPDGDYAHAALVHDYLYRETDWPRERCDQIFREAMEELDETDEFDIGPITRWTLFRAVRLFGGLNRESKT